MLSPIRVLVVDDSALIRQMLIRVLELDPRIEVVAVARNGIEAIEKAKELDPDVITLDVEMPELTGIEALPHIRRHTRARVVMLSSLQDPSTTYRALALGAVDFMPKPTARSADSMTELSELILKKIKTAYRITPARAAAAAGILSKSAAEDTLLRFAPGVSSELAACVVLAASTGGPPALERVFAGLRAGMPAAYLVVQHLPAGFSESLARRLRQVTDISVRVAQQGDVVEPGHAYIADYGAHLVVAPVSGRIELAVTEDPPMHGVRPAADPLLESVARTFGKRAVGVVLTGMGSDGARGCLAIREAGGDTIVQDEETSIVWGMPRAAVNAKAACRLVPITGVATEIRRSVRTRAQWAEAL